MKVQRRALLAALLLLAPAAAADHALGTLVVGQP